MDYTTSDIGEAAFIVAHGFRVLDICPEPGDTKRLLFCFTIEAEETGRAYYAGAEVSAQRFATIYKQLKGRVHRAQRQVWRMRDEADPQTN